MTDSIIGRKIGKYEIVENLGRGGMAQVYKGYQESLDRYVAIKLMHSFLVTEEDFLFRFKREARAMASLNHPNIVRVYDFDVYGEDTYYLVMEYVSGGSLKAKLEQLARDDQRLSMARSVQIAQEVADALAYAHSRGMVHRDIKPANIMLNERGKAVLTDFGIVKMLGGQSMAYTATGALVGTPAYMSPEQALGKPGDERCDLYSLGVLLFQMVTGQLPFAADTPLAVVMKHVNDPTPSPVTFNPEVPYGLQEIILKAMAKDPDERYQKAEEVATDLRAVDLSAGPTPPETVAPTTTVVSATRPTDSETAVSEQTSPAATAVTTEATEADTAAAAEATPTLPDRKGFPWLWAGAGLVVLLLIGGIVGGINWARGNAVQPTVPMVVAAATDAEAETTSAPATATTEPTSTPEPQETVDVVATAIAQTREAQPTQTAMATPTSTSRPTETPTPDATRQFLANCVEDVELVVAYTYQNRRFRSAPVSASFPMNWVLKNSGTCPWPADLVWTYQDGNTFGYDDGPIPLGTDAQVAAEEEVTLTTTFIAPGNTGTFESTWQLANSDGEPFGPPLTFEISAYVPATDTPRPTDTPAVTPTATAEITELDWIYVVQQCEYIGTEWRCQVEITPYGGGGGPYTVWVFDQPSGQPKEYRGPGPYYHWAKSRRCAAYNHEVKVQDDATGNSFSDQMYIEPDSHFEGGCTEQ